MMCEHVRLSIDGGYPNSWMVFAREIPIKMDGLGVPPFVGNHHLYKVVPPNEKETYETEKMWV